MKTIKPEEFNKFADFAKKSGYHWYIPGQNSYMDTRTGSVMTHIAEGKVQITKKNGVSEAEFKDIEDEEVKKLEN
jgi:hypothetical protein